MNIFYDSSAQFSIEKIFEMYTNSHSETINIIGLLQYSYIQPKYETISPCNIKIHTQDDKKIITTEKYIHNYMINEEHSVTTYAESAQEQNICAFYDNDDYVISRDVFMGYPEANKPQFTMDEYLYIDNNNNNNIDDQYDATVYYHIDSINTLFPIDLM